MARTTAKGGFKLTSESYPQVVDSTPERLADLYRQIARLRENDISDFDNLPNRFLTGRKVNKIPTASNDITGSRVGDFNYDADYIYICVDNSGAAWRRVAIGSW